MALPTNPSTEWPPPSVVASRAEIDQLSAWYGGDKASIRLTAGDNLNPLKLGPTDRQSPSLLTSRAIHVPLAADIARTSADLLFSETPEITTVEEAVKDRLDVLIDQVNLQALLLENAELCAALGGIFWRMTWDADVVEDRPIPTFIQPDFAVPEWRWGVLIAVTFWRDLPPITGQPNGSVYRHLERHSKALIEHGLYFGDGSRLGQQVPLVEHPETAGLAEAMNSDLGFVLPPDAPRTFGYIPNVKPNRRNRHSPLGRADVDGEIDVLQAVDDTWTSWMRDLRLAKARLVVPTEYLRPDGRGRGATFDVDRELYEPLKMAPPQGSAAGQQMQLVQFAIRFAEHEATLKALVQQVVTGAGYSLQTFGFATDATAAATATEVTARERLSMTTRERKTRYWSPELKAFLEALLYLDELLFGGTFSEVEVEFQATVKDDPKTVAETLNLLAQAAAISTELKVRTLHPDWDDTQIEEEIARIRDDAEALMPDPLPDPIGAGELNPDGEKPDTAPADDGTQDAPPA